MVYSIIIHNLFNYFINNIQISMRIYIKYDFTFNFKLFI